MEISTALLLIGLMALLSMMTIKAGDIFAWLILGFIGLISSLFVIGQIDQQLVFIVVGIAFMLIAFMGGRKHG